MLSGKAMSRSDIDLAIRSGIFLVDPRASDQVIPRMSPLQLRLFCQVRSPASLLLFCCYCWILVQVFGPNLSTCHLQSMATSLLRLLEHRDLRMEWCQFESYHLLFEEFCRRYAQVVTI